MYKPLRATSYSLALLMYLLLSMAQFSFGYDAPPKDQGHSGPGAGSGDPNNPNGPNPGEGGDPIHIRGGNFTTSQEDLLILGRAMPILVKRHYNSHDNFHEGPFGFGWSFSYDITATEVTDGSGVTQVIIRDGDGVQHIFTETDSGQYEPPRGRYNQLINTGANAYEVTRKDAVRLIFSQNRLQRIVDLSGNQLTLSYAADGKLIAVTSPANRTVSFSYGSNNKISTLTDAIGRTVAYAYDSSGNLISVTNPAGQITRYTYDSEHHLVSIVDANGVTRLTNTYNADAQITQQVSDGRLYRYLYTNAYTRVQGPNGRYVYHYFNDNGNTIRRINQLNENVYYSYDENSQLTQITDPRGNITRYTYDTLGNISSETDADNRTTTFQTHAVYGVLTHVTDSLGRVTQYNYNTQGKLIQKIDALGNTTSFSYNAQGQVIETTDEAGKRNTLIYNSAGDLISISNARGDTTQFEYDAVGRRTRLIDPLGNAITYQYDVLDRVVSQSNALGESVSFVYDATGNVTRAVDPNGNATVFGYNQYGLRTSVTDALGNTTTYSYDAAGNVTGTVDALGNSIARSYDFAHRVTSLTLADGSVTAFLYDTAGNNTRITDPLGNVINFTYDGVNRVVDRTYPDGSTENRVHDAVGNVTAYQDRSGKTSQFTYDALDRMVQKTLHSGDTESITFNNLGFIAAVTNKNGTASYSYDNADRVSSITDVFGNVYQYEYDAAGRRTRMIDPDGAATSYSYDRANRLTQVTNPSGTTSFSYDSAGRLLSRILPNGITSNYVYDNRDLVTSLSHVNALGVTLARFQYTYDAVGNRTQLIELNGDTTDYQYDDVYRLVRESKRASDSSILSDIQYEYDLNGNRTRLINNAVTTNYSYNNLSQLLSTDTKTYAYDGNGNLITVTESSQITHYQYDDENQLVRIVFPDGSQIDTRYDPQGKRIETIAPGKTTRFIYDQNALLGETDATGVREKTYHRNLGLISLQTAGNSLYYLADAMGSVRLLADASANVTDSYDYDAFGNVTAHTGSTDNPFRFAGNWGFYNTGALTHIGARYYAPEMGRFLTVDPLAQGTNWYIYGLNDPVNLIDPDGQWVHIAIGAGLGALIHTGIYLYSTPRSQWSLGGGVRAAATGAVAGGVGAATFGASLPAALGGTFARGAISGVASLAATDLTNSAIDQKVQISSPLTYLGAAVGGGVLSKVGSGLSRARQSANNVVKCFVPGTLVLMADGSTKPIEKIEPGEWVKGDNPEDGQAAAAYKVLARLESKTHRIVRVAIDSGDGVIDGHIESTGQHPYWTQNRGWQYAEDLQVGDVLLDADSDVSYIVDVTIEKRDSPTYNLSIDDVQTYFVVAGEQSVLVHNVDPFRFSSESNRWHGPNGQFVESPSAGQMRDWARSQGWTNTHTTPAGFETWSDANGQKRMKIKPASTQQGLHANSQRPRVTIWDASGQRVDGFGRAVAKKSVTAHAPLKACP